MADVNVTYNGNSILTMNGNATNTLLTSGKYLEDDITLTHQFNFIGSNAELVKSYAKTTTKLSDTNWTGWTPSSTAKSLLATATIDTVSIDMDNYDYVIQWRFYVAPVYGSSATNTGRFVSHSQTLLQYVFRRPSNITNLQSNTYNGNAQSSPALFCVMDYYNSSGTRTVTWSVTYGIYITATAPTFGSSTALSTTLNVRRPVITARTSDSYMTVANAQAITAASTNLLLDCKLYRVQKQTSLGYNVYHNTIEIYRNGDLT